MAPESGIARSRKPIATARAVVKWVLLLSLCHATGTAWHEVMGHGLVGVICGGKIQSVEVFTIQLYPKLASMGWDWYFGQCGVMGIGTEAGESWMSLGGSLSTGLVSAIVIGLLWTRRWRGWPKTVLALLGLWWLDMMTYTLPSWGLRRLVIVGRRFAEPYDAAVALGMPGWMFQTAVIGSSVILALALVVRLNWLRSGAGDRPPSNN